MEQIGATQRRSENVYDVLSLFRDKTVYDVLSPDN